MCANINRKLIIENYLEKREDPGSERIRSDSFGGRHSDSSASRVNEIESRVRIVFRVAFTRVESPEILIFRW